MSSAVASVIHPLDEHDAHVVAATRAATASHKGHVLTGIESRGPFNTFIASQTAGAATPSVSYSTEPAVSSTTGLWCHPPSASREAVLLFLHGGAYVVGTADGFRHFAGQFAVRTGISTYVLEYRLAPEHPFPAAVDDAAAAVTGLLAMGYSSIGVVAESAGGGLAASLCSTLTADTLRSIKAFCLVSPWLDLTLSGASHKTRAEADPIFLSSNFRDMATLYVQGSDLRDPRASPLFAADLSRLSPMQLHVGDDELLLDDSTRLAERVQAGGGKVELHIWLGMAHVFPSSMGKLKAADAATDSMCTFLKQHML